MAGAEPAAKRQRCDALPSSLYNSIDLAGSTVLVTGATAGFGNAIAWRYAELGCRLALIGRRAERLEQFKKDASERFPAMPPPVLVPLDLNDLSAVEALPQKLKDAGMPHIDILVNNAGLALGVAGADGNNIGDAQTMFTVNVLAVMALVRGFAPDMKERGVGHIVNISSVAAHDQYAGGSIYCATKSALNAFTIAARHDLVGTPIRVTAISPGLAETEFSMVRFGGDTDKAKKVYENIVALSAEDIADQVIYATTRPRHVQVAEITTYATNQSHAKYVVERKGASLGGPTAAL